MREKRLPSVDSALLSEARPLLPAAMICAVYPATTDDWAERQRGHDR